MALQRQKWVISQPRTFYLKEQNINEWWYNVFKYKTFKTYCLYSWHALAQSDLRKKKFFLTITECSMLMVKTLRFCQFQIISSYFQAEDIYTTTNL